MILAVDPGDTNGVALFTESGTEELRFQASFDELAGFLLARHDITKILVEDYRLRQGKQAAQTGSRFPAVQMIGALRLYARMRGIQTIILNVQAKTLGAMYSGVKQPSNHKLSHQVDAYNMGIYWLVNERIIDPPNLAKL